MTRKAITAGVLLTMAMALAAPAGAITLRADVAGMDTSNPNWAALGIAPVDTMQIEFSFDETSPRSFTSEDDARFAFTETEYALQSINVTLGTLQFGGPVTAVNNAFIVRDAIRHGTFPYVFDQVQLSSAEPWALPGGNAAVFVSLGLFTQVIDAFSGPLPTAAELSALRPSTGLFEFRLAGEQGTRRLSGDDVTFTNVAIAPVPLPAAGWMLLAGLLGFVALKARREPA
jgi:hypothetical protein